MTYNFVFRIHPKDFYQIQRWEQKLLDPYVWIDDTLPLGIGVMVDYDPLGEW